MLNKILGEKIYNNLEKNVGLDKINEIRFRTNLPIMISSLGQVYYLGENGLTLSKNQSLFATKQMLEDIVYKASEFSIYSVNEEIKQGYIVLDAGERIGVAGSMVMDGNSVKTITNFTSINIRLPHIIKGCSLPVFEKLVGENEIYNTLIVSPPGQGKTTFLRDFAYQLSRKNYFYNLLVLDERGEIAGKNNILELGDFCDVLSFCSKKVGFLQGIRSMNPDIILTDELGESDDFDAVKFASNSGVKVVATIHASNLEQLKNKPNFPIISNIFERYVLLSPNGKAGTIQGIYGKNFSKI